MYSPATMKNARHGAGPLPYYQHLRALYRELFYKYFPVLIAFAALCMLGSVLRCLATGWSIIYTVQVATLLLLVLARYVEKKDMFISGWIVQVMLLVNGVIVLSKYGLGSMAMSIFLVSIISTALFFGARAGLAAALFYNLVFAGIGSAIVSGTIPAHRSLSPYLISWPAWVSQGTGFLFLGVLTVLLMSVAQRYLFDLIKVIHEREIKFRSIVEQTNGIIVITASDLTIREFNPEAERVFGYAREQVQGRNFTEQCIPAEEHSMFGNHVAECLKNGGIRGVEHEISAAHGVRRNIVWNISTNSSGDAAAGGIIFFGQDITDRKRADETLRDSEARYRSLFESANDAIFILDNGKIVDCNPKALDMFGYYRNEMIGLTPAQLTEEFLPDGTHAFVKTQEKIDAALTAGSQSFEWRHIRKDGTSFDAGVSLSKFVINGHPMLLAIVRDITGQKNAAAAVLREKEFSDAIINTLPGVFFLYEEGRRLVRWNRYHEALTGVFGEANYHKAPEDFVADTEKQQVRIAIDEALRIGQIIVEIGTMSGEGKKIPFLYSAIKFVENDTAYLLGTGIDISALKQAEANTRESEVRFRQIAENIEEAFFLLEKESRQVLYASPAIEKIFGLKLHLIYANPQVLIDAIHPDDRENVQITDVVKRYSQTLGEEFRICRPDGTIRWVRLNTFLVTNNKGVPYRTAGIINDITEYRAAQDAAQNSYQQLIQADKMASLGTMVSGVAHEINNPNNLIMLNADVMKTFWKPMRNALASQITENGDLAYAGIPAQRALEKFETLIDGVAGGAVRIKQIVQNLKDFARIDAGNQVETIMINAVVESSISIIHAGIRAATTNFSVSLEEHIPPLKGSFQKLEQVIINLVNNSCQSLSDRSQKIDVSTRFDASQQEIIVIVRDEGAGIAKENLQKIFDPFFTTKRDTGGTGLGLSVSYGIIKEHNGQLDYESQPGKGTTATIRLPVGSR